MAARQFLLLVAVLSSASALAGPADLADGLFSRGMYELAAKEYADLLTRTNDAERATWLFRLGESQRQVGKTAEAIESFNQLLACCEDSPYGIRAKFRRAELRVNGGSFIEAVNDFRVLSERTDLPADLAGAVHFYLGLSQGGLQLTADATRAYRKVVTDFSDSSYFPYASLELATLYRQQGGRDEEVIEIYRKALRKPGSDRLAAELWFQLGDLAYRRKDYATSAEAFENLISRYQSDQRSNEARKPAAWSFLQTARYGDAMRITDAAMSRASEDLLPEWLYIKANILRRQKKGDDARQVYRQLLANYAKSPFAPLAAYETAVSAFEDGNHAAVVEVSSWISPTNDWSGDFTWMLGESYRLLDKRDQALAAYRRLAGEYPAHAQVPWADLQAARLLQDQKKWADASKAYEQVTKDHARHDVAPQAMAASAFCFLQLGRTNDAVASWNKLATAYPDYAELEAILLAKARAEADGGNEKAARETLNGWLKNYPKSKRLAEAHLLRGLLMERSGDAQVAEFHYRSAIASEPPAEPLRELQLRLAAVLQQQGKSADAAALLMGLLETPSAKQLPVALLEWLARWQLSEDHPADAERVAVLLAARSESPATRRAAWFIAGRARQQQEKWAEARTAFEKVLADPGDDRETAEAALFLGQSALEQGDHEAAQKWLESAGKRATGDDVADILARSYFDLGRNAAAKPDFESAARYFLSVGLLFDDASLAPESLYRAAQMLGKAGKSEDREKTLKELHDRYPDSSWSKKDGKE